MIKPIEDGGVPMTEQVAKLINGVTRIGEAEKLLHLQGWTTQLTGNRITVNEQVVIVYIPAKIGDYGVIGAAWVVLPINAAEPTWIVGAEVRV